MVKVMVDMHTKSTPVRGVWQGVREERAWTYHARRELKPDSRTSCLTNDPPDAVYGKMAESILAPRCSLTVTSTLGTFRNAWGTLPLRKHWTLTATC